MEPVLRAASADEAQRGFPEVDPDGLRDEYARETARLLRRRIDPTSMLFLLFVGLASGLEIWTHPERRAWVLFIYSMEALVCVLAVIGLRLTVLLRHAVVVAALAGAALAVLMNVYTMAVPVRPELQALAVVCLMTAFAALLPVGWQAQCFFALSALVSFAFASFGDGMSVEVAYSLVALSAGATASVLGAYFLERYRYDAFRRAALLHELISVTREEARISSALARVGATLGANMGRADVFEKVNQLAVEILGCDFSSTFVFDEALGGYRLAANFGLSPEAVAELGSFEFPAGSLPLFARFQPGELVEIQDANHQALVPVELLRRFETTSALYVPIWRGSKIVGVIVNGYRGRTGPFSPTQRRIALGMGHAAAIAAENERLVADLQAASRLKSEFVSTMSHELRTPLNVITGYAEMLADPQTGALSTDQLDLVQRVNHNAGALLELIDATLDLGRLESGRDVLNHEWFGLDELFAQLDGELEALARAGGTTLEWHRGGLASQRIRSDRGKLKMIVKNLVGNAIKFAPGGNVTVSAGGTRDALLLEVRDNGVGIAGEKLADIFEMFHQLDSSRQGVGLGLHIVKRLVERLSGKISVESTPGRGSTFRVLLPMEFESALPAGVAARPSGLPH